MRKYCSGLMMAMCLLAPEVLAYKIEGGQSFVGVSMGANVNVKRYEVDGKETPRAQLPLALSYHYAIDKNVGVFAGLAPQFSAGSVNMLMDVGLKYWFSFFDAPYVPYIGLAFTPAFLLPVGNGVKHVNLGATSSVGMNFFVMANFLVGAHVNFYPSYAYVGDEKKFEFAVNGMLDVTFRL